MNTAAAVEAPAVNQCNFTEDGGGRAIRCDVTVTNNLDTGTGETSSTVVVRECHGAANTAPTSCTETTTPSTELVTSVDQCNNAANGGGSTVDCHVRIVNNITGDVTPTPATINQCNGSGAEGTEPTTDCSPVGSTTNATIEQCNGSANGGGAQRRVQCDVYPSTEVSLIPVTVDQCNDSANGGGSTVRCSVQIVNNIIPTSGEAPEAVTPVDVPGLETRPVPPETGNQPPSGGSGSGGSTGGSGSGLPNGGSGGRLPIVVPASNTFTPIGAMPSERDSALAQADASNNTATGLPVTGSSTAQMALLGLIALMLGFALISVSKVTAVR